MLSPGAKDFNPAAAPTATPAVPVAASAGGNDSAEQQEPSQKGPGASAADDPAALKAHLMSLRGKRALRGASTPATAPDVAAATGELQAAAIPAEEVPPSKRARREDEPVAPAPAVASTLQSAQQHAQQQQQQQQQQQEQEQEQKQQQEQKQEQEQKQPEQKQPEQGTAVKMEEDVIGSQPEPHSAGEADGAAAALRQHSAAGEAAAVAAAAPPGAACGEEGAATAVPDSGAGTAASPATTEELEEMIIASGESGSRLL